MKWIDPNPDKTAATELFKSLFNKPQVIRFLYEAEHGPCAWMGWAPMLCEIVREAAKKHKDRAKAAKENGDVHV